MVNNIVGGQGIIVSGSSSSRPYVNMSMPSSGMVRYNGTNFEVYDGSIWQIIQSSYPMIELSSDVHELLQWAKLKRDYEFKVKTMADKHPELADAANNLKRAQEQFDLLLALSQDHTVK
jgi:hypothetical protein